MITDTSSTPLVFNLVHPDRGYGGQDIELLGARFSLEVNYYAKFGDLEPTLFFRKNPGSLLGVVPKMVNTGPVPVIIVTQEGVPLCHSALSFTYIGYECENP